MEELLLVHSVQCQPVKPNRVNLKEEYKNFKADFLQKPIDDDLLQRNDYSDEQSVEKIAV